MTIASRQRIATTFACALPLVLQANGLRLASQDAFRQDRSPDQTPKDFTDIYDVSEQDFPPAYREALRRYYRTLSSGRDPREK